MPTIAIVEGIVTLLYFNDHAPAHFRAQGADFHAQPALRTVRQALAHREELVENWQAVRAGQSP